MAFEDRELSGVAFRTKSANANAPAWRGTLLVNGEPAELAIWEKQGRKGAYLSFQIGPRREQRRPDDDSTPF